MDRSLRRAAVVQAALLAALGLIGCSTAVPARAPATVTRADAAAADLHITGASTDPVDVGARNALVDLQDYWSGQFPSTFGKKFEPLQGGYFSVDPEHVDPAEFPDGVGCGSAPQDVKNNAFYCQEPNTPHSDSITYDRTFLAGLADQYGQFLPDLVMAHEYGHAVQARTSSPPSSIATETQADCYAGTWTRWVADGHAAHTMIRKPDLDQLLRGYLRLRDPVGTSSAAQMAHGSAFDRISAFQEGYDSGPASCRDDFGADRVFTQGTFSDADLATGGNAPYDQLQGIMSSAFPQFWKGAFSAAGKKYTEPSLEPFSTTAPACATAQLDLVYCPKGPLVGYDEPDLTEPAYRDIGDYAVVTAVAVPYGLGARDQLGRSAHDGAAYRSAVCLAGWFSAAVFSGRIDGLQVSPGDLDEGVQFLLRYGQDPKVLPGADRSGFQLVDLFRQGFLHGGQPCGVAL
jgi:predicted metalloprotease